MHLEKEFRDGSSPKEGMLFWELRRGIDVKIADLYDCIHPGMKEMNVQLQQRLLGGFFARINRRLKEHGHVIRPGVMRQTYRLWTIKAWEAYQQEMKPKKKTRARRRSI